jgi:hypothetical protein
MAMRLTQAEKTLMTKMIKEGFLYREVAKLTKRSRESVACFARRSGLCGHGDYHKRGTYFEKKDEIIKLYQNHTAKETAKKLKLSLSQVRHCIDIAYKKNEVKPKDTRERSAWLAKDYLTMLRYAGLKERAWIAIKMGRSTTGKPHTVKRRIGKLGSRYANGLTLSLVSEIFPDATKFAIQSNAGSGGISGQFKPIIVPWVCLDILCRKNPGRVSDDIACCIAAMSDFQKMVHGIKNPYALSKKLIKLTKEDQANDKKQ